MNAPRCVRRWLLTPILLLVLATGGGGARAQLPSLDQAGLNAAMTKLFGDFTGFSTRTEVRVKETKQALQMTMFMDFALLDGKMRADIDLTQIRSQDLSSDALANFKRLGMEKWVTIVRPDRKSTLVSCPAHKSWVEVPLPKQEAEELAGSFKVARTKLGAEVVEGHPCTKYRITVTSQRGAKNEAVVWCAADAKEFPIQMQFDQPGATVVMIHRNVRLTKPELKLFDMPADYTKHESVEKMMQAAMLKAMGGLGK